MVHVVVVTHGRFGEELLKAAEMIVGEINGVDNVSLLKEDNPLSFEEKIRRVLWEKEEELLFLADIYGGTPCNTAVSILKSYPAWIVTGVNLAMLLEVATTFEEVSQAKEMAENLMNISASSCQILNRNTMKVEFEEEGIPEGDDL
ncbi:hypothetical protein AALB16_11565 [Lachnospiraceae bacterium 62-35]